MGIHQPWKIGVNCSKQLGEFPEGAHELCLSVQELVVVWKKGTGLLCLFFGSFLLGARQSVTYGLSHQNGWHDRPRRLWAFGCVDMLGMSYALGDFE